MFDKYKDVLSVNEVCEALHIGKNTIYEYLKTGVIKSIKVGKKYLIPKCFLIDFINQYR
jgi:excisionase family DNA binding protein